MVHIRSWFKNILSHKSAQEDLLGFKDFVPPTDQQILDDANKLVHFTRGAEYAKWAEEVWAQIITHLDALCDDNLTDAQLHLHRGQLKASLNLLRIAAKAQAAKKELEQRKEQSASTAR